MKKILIADDELLVRVGLKITISWEENGFVVVGEAKNGKEAIELFEEHDPDILLTDIRMPIINGLELIQELKARKSSLKAVILTHYDDFNYAKEAIKLGASEYILKSDLSQENILAVMKKLAEELTEPKNNAVEALKGLKTQDSDNTPGIDTLFSRIVTGGYKSRKELLELLKAGRSFFRQGLFCFAVSRILSSDSNEKPHGAIVEALQKNIDNITRQVSDISHIYPTICYTEYEIIYLFNIEGARDGTIAVEKVRKQMEGIKKNIVQFLDIDMFVGISNTSGSFERIPELVENARTALNYCFFEPSGIVAYNEDVSFKDVEVPKVHLENLRILLNGFERDLLNKYIERLFDEIYEYKSISCVREMFIDFLSYGKIIAEDLKLNNQPAFNEQKFNYGNFEKLKSFEMTKKYISDLYNELANQIGEGKAYKYSFVISKCIEYIKQNYHKNISLADAADYVEISRSYLSLLFKQETGINFSSFLTNYRIEKSKKYLTESNYKIYEIAEKVGFDNPYYFSKVFKEVTGVSCKEFKKA